jgi:hypothetical protein
MGVMAEQSSDTKTHLWRVFHRAWSEAKDRNYSKPTWVALEKALLSNGLGKGEPSPPPQRPHDWWTRKRREELRAQLDSHEERIAELEKAALLCAERATRHDTSLYDRLSQVRRKGGGV